ncbi:MAG: 2-C-methyl-D-erythritol 4-phosphate cytidylyltransferase [Candidatus Thermochlorobacter sp.]
MRGYSVIAAGGLSRRMNLRSGESKQYLRLGRHAVIYYALKAFEEAETIQRVAVATRQEDIERLKKLVKREGFSKISAIVPGGEERQDSIYNALECLAEEIEALPQRERRRAVVLIHDGARPFIQPDEIDRIAKLACKFGAAVPATKPKDTLKLIDKTNDCFGATLDRTTLMQVQTPQGFHAELIIAAHRAAQKEKFYATDDAALIEKFFPDQPIKIFEMGYHNLKITTPEDLDLAKAMLKRLQRR